MARYGLLVDVERCNGCDGCVVGCKNWHGIPAGEGGRIRIIDKTAGDFPDVKRWIFPVLCMQCEYPPCVAVCRFQACFVNETGIVQVIEKKCVGCELCVVACPYGARVMRKNKIPDSCDFCLDRLEEGEIPYCVASCPNHALIFGDLDNPDGILRKTIVRKRARPLKKRYGTRPRVYYTHAEDIEALIP